MCLHEPPRRFPPSQRAGGVAPAAAAVTCRRWTCTLTTDERGSASSTISLLERHVRCGGPHAVVRVGAANRRRSRAEWLARRPRVRGRPCPRCPPAALGGRTPR